MKRTLAPTLAILVAACAPADDDPGAGDVDLSLGDLSDEDMKDDGVWGAALTCKAIPVLPPLPSPRITISIEGLTLRLTDTSVGYDRVFPIGVGQIDTRAGSSTRGESLTYWPIKNYKKNLFYLRPSTNVACKTWWTDPDTGQRSPVFAGLPFMSFSGSYAIHGPIDNFRAPSGGNLRRGFVSHGCVRMESKDVLEVYGRVKHHAQVPVWVQREPERTATERVDVDPPWIGAECEADADCAFADGFCHRNPYSGRGFCTARCSRVCTDKPGYPTTFCVPDPDAPGQGMCVAKVAAVNAECRPYDHFEPLVAARHTQATVTASVCLPGSPGAIGDRCFFTSDCDPGNVCAGATGGRAGLCTQACTRTCPDSPGSATTFCVSQPALGGARCLRTCTPSTNAPECPAGTRCVQRGRNGEPATVKHVCEPV
jgi:hypothetical protein